MSAAKVDIIGGRHLRRNTDSICRRSLRHQRLLLRVEKGGNVLGEDQLDFAVVRGQDVAEGVRLVLA
jgi:hypothetical protein